MTSSLKASIIKMWFSNRNLFGEKCLADRCNDWQDVFLLSNAKHTHHHLSKDIKLHQINAAVGFHSPCIRCFHMSAIFYNS